MLSKCKNLIGLSLAYCIKVGDMGVTKISQNCTSLKNLILYRCELISDEAMSSIASYLHNLKLLDLRYCYKISDRGIEKIAKKCGFLTFLYLDSSFYRKSFLTENEWYQLFTSSTICLFPSTGPMVDQFWVKHPLIIWYSIQWNIY